MIDLDRGHDLIELIGNGPLVGERKLNVRANDVHVLYWNETRSIDFELPIEHFVSVSYALFMAHGIGAFDGNLPSSSRGQIQDRLKEAPADMEEKSAQAAAVDGIPDLGNEAIRHKLILYLDLQLPQESTIFPGYPSNTALPPVICKQLPDS